MELICDYNDEAGNEVRITLRGMMLNMYIDDNDDDGDDYDDDDSDDDDVEEVHDNGDEMAMMEYGHLCCMTTLKAWKEEKNDN